MRLAEVPDIVFPGDPVYGIPLLDASMQATLTDTQFVGWGSRGRLTAHVPGYHFYVQDYRFQTLWKQPHLVVNAGVGYVVEPNITTTEEMALAEALGLLYRKRWIARFWQHHGIRTLVDVNVARRFREMNLLGVPEGWYAYSTRGYSDRPHEVMDDFRTAADHAGTDEITFWVFGGDRRIQSLCRDCGFGWHPGHPMRAQPTILPCRGLQDYGTRQQRGRQIAAGSQQNDQLYPSSGQH